MENENIFIKLSKEKTNVYKVKMCEIISNLYDIKYNATNSLESKEKYDYNRQWWKNKEKELLINNTN
jgi:hypothetical protein